MYAYYAIHSTALTFASTLIDTVLAVVWYQTVASATSITSDAVHHDETMLFESINQVQNVELKVWASYICTNAKDMTRVFFTETYAVGIDFFPNCGNAVFKQ